MDNTILDRFSKLKQKTVFNLPQESSQDQITLPNQIEALEEEEQENPVEDTLDLVQEQENPVEDTLDLVQEQENSVEDTLGLVGQDFVDFNQLAQEYQQDQENQQDPPSYESTQLLEWRKQRRKYSSIPPSLFAKGKGTSIRAIRAHDSDLRLYRPTVLLPALYREHGVSLPMGYEALGFDLVHIRPWTYHDLYGIKYEEENLFFPEFDQEIKFTPIRDDDGLNEILRKYIRTLLGNQAYLLLTRQWFQLNTFLSVLSEEHGVSYLRSYAMIVDRETVADIQKVRDTILRMQTDWSDLREEEKRNQFRDYMERVYRTQTLFFLLPLVKGIVPEARRSARTFLVFDPVSKQENDDFIISKKGFYLPGAMTIMTRFGGKPIQREQAILGERLTKEQLVAFLTRNGEELVAFLTGNEEELDDILSSDLNAGEFYQEQVRLRHNVGGWIDDPIIYEVEGQQEFWRKQMMRTLETKLADTFVLTSMVSFFSEQNSSEQQFVQNAEFKVNRYFLFNGIVFTRNIDFHYDQSIMFVCNSTTLVVQGHLIDQYKPHPDQDELRNIVHYNILIIETLNVLEAIIWSWGSTDELQLCVSNTSRHINRGGRIYYGRGLGQYIVIDRNGKSRVIQCPPKILKQVQDEAMKQGIIFGQLELCLYTPDGYVLITNEYRAHVSDMGEKKIKITQSMLISKTIYLVRFIMGAIGKTVLKGAIPFYNRRETYQTTTEFYFRNFRQPEYHVQKLGKRPQRCQPFHL